MRLATRMPGVRDSDVRTACETYTDFVHLDLVMLYKCMNAKRLAMSPTPPLPIYAEKYPCGKASRDDPIRLDVGDGTIITTEEFFGVTPAKSGAGGTYTKASKKNQATKTNSQPLDHISQALYDELLVRRTLLASENKTQPTRIIPDHLLQAIARERPTDTGSLLAIHGIGPIQQKKYGDAWLEVISLFMATNNLEQSTIRDAARDQTTTKPPRTPRRTQNPQRASPDSSPAFCSPLPRTPRIHTGLSFTMAETKLDTEGNNSDDSTPSYDSDDTLLSLDFGSLSRRRISSGTKRKRSASPTKHDVETASQALQELTQPDIARLIHPPSIGPSPMQQAPAKTPMTSRSLSTEPPPAAPTAQALLPASRIARSKLLAFSKLVTRKLPARPANAPPIVTEHTLDVIVRTRPSTQDELERIPGIDTFLVACAKTNSDLFRNVVKFTAALT
jgi:hypothetical protein